MNIMHKDDGTRFCLIDSSAHHLANTRLPPIERINIPHDGCHTVAVVHMVNQSLVGSAIWRTHHPGIYAGNRPQQILSPADFTIHLGSGTGVHLDVTPGMHTELMPLCSHTGYERTVAGGVLPQHEESPLSTVPIQNIQRFGRICGMGAIIKSKRHILSLYGNLRYFFSQGLKTNRSLNLRRRRGDGSLRIFRHNFLYCNRLLNLRRRSHSRSRRRLTLARTLFLRLLRFGRNRFDLRRHFLFNHTLALLIAGYHTYNKQRTNEIICNLQPHDKTPHCTRKHPDWQPLLASFYIDTTPQLW